MGSLVEELERAVCTSVTPLWSKGLSGRNTQAGPETGLYRERSWSCQLRSNLCALCLRWRCPFTQGGWQAGEGQPAAEAMPWSCYGRTRSMSCQASSPHSKGCAETQSLPKHTLICVHLLSLHPVTLSTHLLEGRRIALMYLLEGSRIALTVG